MTDATAIALAVLMVLSLLALVGGQLRLATRLGALERGAAGTAAAASASAARPSPLPALAGTVLPHLDARPWRPAGALPLTALPEEALVLVFLSPGCADCAAAQARIEPRLAALAGAGVRFVLVLPGHHTGTMGWPDGTPLADMAVRIDAVARRALNPKGMVPAYVFAEAGGRIVAAGIIGDADWLAFEAQIDALAP